MAWVLYIQDVLASYYPEDNESYTQQAYAIPYCEVCGSFHTLQRGKQPLGTQRGCLQIITDLFVDREPLAPLEFVCGSCGHNFAISQYGSEYNPVGYKPEKAMRMPGARLIAL